ncbi:MAG: tRNA (adenosine(37)-N6)-dimethylallyltransferase MiaA [Gammaproteobacteria bacterium]|nr:tRNA (adenosine(37)-N6)-dimethylallyltransferase MiaA [Gammaproteobacteria bacterium]
MGPTASGKTAAAMALADRFPVELINVDSAQIYRDMDIGTAKPDAETLARYPHHLMDICDPSERYSAAQFRADALGLMNDIIQRGKVPLLVGGTGLYYRALENGLADMPEADEAIRKEIFYEAAERGWGALHAVLAEVDPESAARIEPTDTQRIQRALEVYRKTGKTLTEHWQEQRAGEQRDELPYKLLKLAVWPQDRAELHRRIEQRFGQMMEAGFLAEVAALKSRDDLDLECPSMRAVGYRQLWQHLEGEFPLDEAVRKGIVASRQYAKRQITWLRSESGLEVFEATDPELASQLADRVEAFIAWNRP